jgi:large conductance mechanosensitive channel
MNLDRSDRGRLVVIASGVVLGLVAFELIRSFVQGLLSPLVGVFIGESRLEGASFTIEGSEFGYGFFIEAVLMAAVAGLIAYIVFPGLLGGVRGVRGRRRNRPERD